MNKLLVFALLFLVPHFTYAESPVMRMEVDNDRDFNPYKSHWLVSFNFEGLKYETPFEFSGARKNIHPKDQELWGGRLGFGGEVYLGKGFMTTTKVEGYYVGTLFARRLNAGPEDEDEDVAFTKRTGQVYGVDVSQSIGYLFDFKTKNPFLDEWAFLTVQPYLEAGIGMARAYNRINYHYDTGLTSNGGVMEDYRHSIEDELTSFRVGGGVSLTSHDGFFFFISAFVNSFDITKRKSESFTRPDQAATGTSVSTSESNVNIDPVTTYALGGGYKF